MSNSINKAIKNFYHNNIVLIDEYLKAENERIRDDMEKNQKDKEKGKTKGKTKRKKLK